MLKCSISICRAGAEAPDTDLRGKLVEAEPAGTERCLILGCTHTKVCHHRAKTDSVVYRKQIMDTFFLMIAIFIYTYIYNSCGVN